MDYLPHHDVALRMITVDIVGDDTLIAKLTAMPNQINQGLASTLRRLQLDFIREVVRKLSGPVLKRRTGVLASSVNLGAGVSRFEQSSEQITMIVGTNVKYAQIHEYGGHTQPHTILPKNARALAFPWKGGQAFFRKVEHPGSKIPERSFLRSTLREMTPRIEEELAAAVQQAVA